MIEVEKAQGGERDINNPVTCEERIDTEEMEAWKEICDKIDNGNLEGTWKFESSNMQVLKSYFECDADILEYLEQAEKNNVEVFFTLHINEEREAAEYAIGAWGADVDYGYDNRVFENDDYEGVIEWLNKIAQEEEE